MVDDQNIRKYSLLFVDSHIKQREAVFPKPPLLDYKLFINF